MSILYMQLHVALSNCRSLKERRAVAQRLRDHIKNYFNVSVKLAYLESQSCFILYVCAVGGDRDYLENLADAIQQKAEVITEEHINTTYDIEQWPFY